MRWRAVVFVCVRLAFMKRQVEQLKSSGRTRRTVAFPKFGTSLTRPSSPNICRYLNSCVGADTLRHFILLLAWLAVALAYCLGLGLVMGFKYRAAILAHTRQLARVRRGAPPVDELIASRRRAAAGMASWDAGRKLFVVAT